LLQPVDWVILTDADYVVQDEMRTRCGHGKRKTASEFPL